jgi:hypothetical protein
MKPLFNSIYSWVDARLDLEGLVAFAKKKKVPQHSQSFWYYWGGLSLLFFIIQAVTGVLLLVYYRPGPDAYESVTNHLQHGFWLAHPFVAFVGSQPDGGFGDGAYVFGFLHESLSLSARVRVVERVGIVGALPGVRI